MARVTLSEPDQNALRALLAVEPVPGRPVPEARTIELLDRLVPCDWLGAACTDMHGHLLQRIEVARRSRDRVTEMANDLSPCRDDSCDGCPHYLGYMHWNKHPREAEWCDVDIAGSDCLAVGFRNGAQHIVQFFFVRDGGQFSETELALLWTLGPVLQRLGRERPTPQLPGNLTVTERRILTYVAAGLSNAEIAEQITVATSTVRKHLENIYRKLGVGNRTAAVARLQGRDAANLDLKERLDRYARAPGAETG
jgi:DNA-binding CsgD family transcriptional regulator